MLSDITEGNTKTDGRDFGFWFVGRIDRWCRENGLPFDAEHYGLRNTGDIEIKWGIYKKGEVRDKWASFSHKTAMSVLIRGGFTFIFREINNQQAQREVRLIREGDYVIWQEDVEHTWRMEEDSEILTLRWASH